jgi:hypothetical protein
MNDSVRTLKKKRFLKKNKKKKGNIDYHYTETNSQKYGPGICTVRKTNDYKETLA